MRMSGETKRWIYQHIVESKPQTAAEFHLLSGNSKFREISKLRWKLLKF